MVKVYRMCKIYEEKAGAPLMYRANTVEDSCLPLKAGKCFQNSARKPNFIPFLYILNFTLLLRLFRLVVHTVEALCIIPTICVSHAAVLRIYAKN